MDKAVASARFDRFKALAHCAGLGQYAEGHNLYGAGSCQGALVNALNGMVLVLLRTEQGQKQGLLARAARESWRIGLVTPVMGYPSTYGANPMQSVSLLDEEALDTLLAVWTLQGRDLPPVASPARAGAGA